MDAPVLMSAPEGRAHYITKVGRYYETRPDGTIVADGHDVEELTSAGYHAGAPTPSTTTDVNGWTVDAQGLVVAGSFGENPPLGPLTQGAEATGVPTAILTAQVTEPDPQPTPTPEPAAEPEPTPEPPAEPAA